MFDVKANIDKDKYTENFNALMAEFLKRENELKHYNDAIEKEAEAKKILRMTSCSNKRIAGVFLFGLCISLPLLLFAELSILSTINQFYSVVLLLMVGLPLLHSFRYGWTLSKYGIVTVTDDVFSFTVMQFFYSCTFCSILLLTILRWP
ncbi:MULTISPECIES: hypothetical protein [unclassified Pseudoalteromonas]|uniref:hypothetical protein n=2 Tax=Pseudoalteromonas TaxID=53246 RepID=UPI00301D1604